ncbi:MAG TPA: precorrin-8X methylmutase [Anaeromyxobacteraceae bacterium]|jgi:precorrin-8X/cobalt-precorrin-8 methylmutase|nr:precorrin-8X methylmutase [Anaeromyxobacteraceae bacterium]
MSDMRQLTAAGRRIEEQSFALIDAEVGPHPFSAAEWQVARRIVHATADLDFARTLVFGPGAVAAGVAALRRGAPVLADVNMIVAGLSRARLAAFACEARCFIGDDDVVAAARASGGTRAAEAVRKARRLGLLDGAVVAVGNAPTALAEVQRLVVEEGVRPALVIGVPVGFVGAAEAKEAALALPVPYLVARGRKGGTPVAVAAVHALLALGAEVAA